MEEECEKVLDMEMVYETEVRVENQKQIQEQLQGHHQEQCEKQSQENQKSLYALHNINTEASIKTEIKQMKLTKVTQETHVKVMREMAFDMEDQIKHLLNKNGELSNENQRLDEQVATDLIQLVESDRQVMKAKEMICFLKGDVDKLEQLLSETDIRVLLDKTEKQKRCVQSLREKYVCLLEKRNNVSASPRGHDKDVLGFLTQELVQKRATVDDLKKKWDELHKITSIADEIEKQSTIKRLLEEKLIDIKSAKNSMENEIAEHANRSLETSRKKEIQLDVCNNFVQRKEVLRKQLSEISSKAAELEAQLTECRALKSSNETKIKELEGAFRTRDENVNKLQGSCTESILQLKQLSTSVDTFKESNDRLRKDLNSVKEQYVEQCEIKMGTLNKNLEHQTSIHRIKIIQLEKQMECRSKHLRFDEVNNEYKSLTESLKTLDESISNETERQTNELNDAKAKLNRQFANRQKAKNYKNANLKFLEEKADNLRTKSNSLEESIKEVQDKNFAIERQITSKLADLKVLEEEKLLKTGMKPNANRKVQFNNVVSFKSPTSSDNSSQNTGQKKNLNQSFQKWLEFGGSDEEALN